MTDNTSLGPELDAGCWMLDAGCWMLDAGCWMLDAGCWMLDAGKCSSGKYYATILKIFLHLSSNRGKESSALESSIQNKKTSLRREV
jgi:hypothetical protein